MYATVKEFYTEAKIKRFVTKTINRYNTRIPITIIIFQVKEPLSQKGQVFFKRNLRGVVNALEISESSPRFYFHRSLLKLTVGQDCANDRTP